MATFTRRVLSGSTDGRPVAVVSTSSPGTTIHTSSTATGTIDHVYLWAVNSAAANRILTVQFGSTATGDDVYVTIPAQDGAYAIIPGWPLVGAATAWIVRAFGTATAGLNVAGYVERLA